MKTFHVCVAHGQICRFFLNWTHKNKRHWQQCIQFQKLLKVLKQSNLLISNALWREPFWSASLKDWQYQTIHMLRYFTLLSRHRFSQNAAPFNCLSPSLCWLLLLKTIKKTVFQEKMAQTKKIVHPKKWWALRDQSYFSYGQFLYVTQFIRS